MPATATMITPDLPGRLADARTEAAQLRADLGQAEQDLAAALDAQDYAGAEHAKGRLEALRPHVALADATAKALADAINALDAGRRAEADSAQRQAREEAAQQAIAEAMAAYEEARETAERHLAEATAGLDAVRRSLSLARQAEEQGASARVAAAQARSSLDGTPMPHPVRPSWASARIEQSALLTAILHGRNL